MSNGEAMVNVVRFSNGKREASIKVTRHADDRIARLHEHRAEAARRAQGGAERAGVPGGEGLQGRRGDVREAKMFRAYDGTDVKTGAGGFAKVDLPGLGEVWATAWPTDEFWRANVNDDPFSVEILGWGQAPTVWWHELTAEQQDALRATL